jgi:hypothetical protein
MDRFLNKTPKRHTNLLASGAFKVEINKSADDGNGSFHFTLLSNPPNTVVYYVDKTTWTKKVMKLHEKVHVGINKGDNYKGIAIDGVSPGLSTYLTSTTFRFEGDVHKSEYRLDHTNLIVGDKVSRDHPDSRHWNECNLVE